MISLTAVGVQCFVFFFLSNQPVAGPQPVFVFFLFGRHPTAALWHPVNASLCGCLFFLLLLYRRISYHSIKTLKTFTPETCTWGCETTGIGLCAACQAQCLTWWSGCPMTTTGLSGNSYSSHEHNQKIKQKWKKKNTWFAVLQIHLAGLPELHSRRRHSRCACISLQHWYSSILSFLGSSWDVPALLRDIYSADVLLIGARGEPRGGDVTRWIWGKRVGVDYMFKEV